MATIGTPSGQGRAFRARRKSLSGRRSIFASPGAVAQGRKQREAPPLARREMVAQLEPDPQPRPLGPPIRRADQDDAGDPGSRHAGAPQPGHELPGDQTAHAVADDRDGPLGRQLGPVRGEKLRAAVDALVVRVAKLPHRVAGSLERGHEVVPDRSRLVQPVDQQDRRGIAGRRAGARVQAVPAVDGRHLLGEPLAQLLVDQHAQPPLLPRMALRPPRPEEP